MSNNLLEELIVEHHKEVKKTAERLKQQKKEFDENNRRIKQEIEKNRSQFPNN